MIKVKTEFAKLNPAFQLFKLQEKEVLADKDSKSEEDDYTVAVMLVCVRHIVEDEPYIYTDISDERLEALYGKYKVILNSITRRASLFIQKNEIIMIFKNMNEKECYSVVKNFQNNVTDELESFEVVFTGIGNTVKGIHDIEDSYIMAGKIAALLKLRENEDDIQKYDISDLDSLLLNINNYQCLEGYYNKMLKPVDDYDNANGTNLHYTLKIYFANNCSVYDTAQELMVHLNTVNEKLKKIQKILGIDIKSFAERNKLAVALDICQIKQLYSA